MRDPVILAGQDQPQFLIGNSSYWSNKDHIEFQSCPLLCSWALQLEYLSRESLGAPILDFKDRLSGSLCYRFSARNLSSISYGIP